MTIRSRLCALALAVLAACQPVATAELAQTPAAPDAPATAAPSPAAAEGRAAPALWKVADEDTTIYLFGTVHILPKGVDWFNGSVAQAFDSSGLLVTEMAGGDPLTMQALVMDKAMLRDGRTLRDLLSAEERAAYEAALSRLGLPPSAFDHFEPWYASIGLSTLPLLREGFANEHGVEEFLQKRAEERGIAQQGLETPEYQLGLFDTLPIEAQKHFLAEIVADLPDIEAELKAIIKAWKSGDAERLAAMMNADQSDPVLVERLLTQRNRAWAQWVRERLDEPGTVFLAVGAGHLAGPGSLRELLAEEGVASERVQ